MPRTKEQNEAVRSQRMEAILQGALHVYVEHGYAAADINDVAERAGVARGLVYYYYKDKRTLFRELVMHMYESANEHTTRFFARDGESLDMLGTFVDHMYTNVFEQSLHAMFFFRVRHDIQALFTKEEIMAQFRSKSFNVSVFSDVIRKGIKRGEIREGAPALLAEQFSGAMMHGMLYLFRRSQELREAGHSMADIAQLLAQEKQDAIASCILILRKHESS